MARAKAFMAKESEVLAAATAVINESHATIFGEVFMPKLEGPERAAKWLAERWTRVAEKLNVGVLPDDGVVRRDEAENGPIRKGEGT